MYILYADESGNTGTDFDNSQQPIFVLSSVLVNENNWHNINRLLDNKKAFKKELASFFPVIHQKYVDNIIEYPMFLDSDSTNYIQIADILSFYVNKYYSIQNGYQKYGEEKENTA